MIYPLIHAKIILIQRKALLISLANERGFKFLIMAKKSTNSSYTGKQIVVLEGLEPVRKRPAMYIGSTDKKGVHHIVTEIIDNSVDEALAGYASNIWITLHKDNSVTVTDDGRGIPIDEVPQYKKSALEIVMTKLHAGGKFNSNVYKVSGGLHGVGASVVNALSENMTVQVKREHKIFEQQYKRGVPITKVTEATKTSTFPKFIKSGTLSTFLPDKEIFKEGIDIDPEILKKSLRDRAYLIPKLFFHLVDERDDSEMNFYFEGGIASLVEDLNKNKAALTNPIYLKKITSDLEIEVALQYNDSFSETVESFVNVINTAEGGTHLTGFRMALTRAVNDYGRKINVIKDGEEGILGEDTREGLTAVVYVKMSSQEIQFEGQTKGKLGNASVQPVVQAAVKENLEMYFEENPSDARKILEKVMLASRARLAAKAAKDAIIRKGALEGSTLPGTLADCQSKDPSESELFVVEGDSAGGSAKQGRDRKFQAILPLFGKVLNTERARIDQIIQSDKFKNLIIAVGAGIADQYNLEKLRYHRIIIMTDADIDGSHIKCLYLTFFYRHLPEIVARGHIYVAMPPLFKIQLGKTVFYAHDEAERDEILKKFSVQSSKSSVSVQRYKGLGEMNASELWETTMNPATRLLKQVTIADAAKADEVFTMLMGNEVPPRKRFIQTHAKTATLDV